VAVFDGQKHFNFKMDENVLAVRLQEWRRRQGAL
jgi:ribosomal protein S19